MAKIKRRGESGAAKNYITRNQAIKKLQVSLADFRRLCILKGIYPREPLNKKRANKGSSAPATFYYHKDIQYLLHEPLLVKFREHKAFAKKLARAVGRQEWALAKNLEDAKPIARLDHLVKERYPTFTLALQDLQDPLNLIHLFSNLPTNPVPGRTLVPIEVIEGCGRLCSEWKVWAIKTHSLRKVFLGIKGIYYECLVPGQLGEPVRVRWLEGYEFQQHVPHDVDFRILLTFIDLYRTLISFVLYKLYTMENLVYPPPLDRESDERGEGVGAYRLVEQAAPGVSSHISKKQVKRVIQGIVSTSAEDVEMDDSTPITHEVEEEKQDDDFVERPFKGDTEDIISVPLPTYSSLVASSSGKTEDHKLLFEPYTFYLSREVSQRAWEFVIKALGGKVITSLQASSPDQATGADSITHVVCDRPMTTERIRELEGGRKWVWVQPQWVADSVNAGKILSSEEYGPERLLPPHLSPWDGEGELERPWLGIKSGMESQVTTGDDVQLESNESEEEEQQSEVEDHQQSDDEENEEQKEKISRPALSAAAQNPTDLALLHAAELEAETSGIPHSTFQQELKTASKRHISSVGGRVNGKQGEEDLRKIMMTNKKAKLYEKMKYGNAARAEEKDKLEKKRKDIERRNRKNQS
ncbi:pescadillo [Tremella mesenterica]|uniref:Pescadillo homolog n=1 Tax=Tremella mesenterica TaxID=5217 RepID=A0A4Q1BBU8_TREME|nr:pescadillo [Tremella mesenterica]